MTQPFSEPNSPRHSQQPPPLQPPPLQSLQYEAPQTLSYASPRMPGGYGVWRQGDRVVATRESDLGDACVKCGAAADGWRWNKTVYWHEPWLFVLIFFPGLLIYLIVALALRKSAKVSAGLCPAHRARRNRGLMIATALTILGAGGIVGGIVVSAESRRGGEWGVLGVLAGFALLIAAVVVANTMARVLTPKKIDAHYAWYGGAGEGYLRSLASTG